MATLPLWVALWPLSKCIKAVDQNFLSYLTGRILRDKDRIYSIKFVWYNDSVYEHQFLRGTAREPIFAQGLKRETKDLLELLLLGAGDIQHRTKKGFKRFKNVPFASLWLGSAIDSLLDYRRKGQVALERKRREDDDSDQSRIEDAIRDEAEDWDDEEPDGTDSQTSDDPVVDCDDFASATAV